MQPSEKQLLATQLKNVEIEINSRCNRRCTYCPVSILPNPDVPKFMQAAVLDRVIDQLNAIDYAGRLSYHFYNEPLLRKDLEAIVARVRDGVPDVHQVLYTNGDYLTEPRYETLRAAGIEFFVITSHDGKTHPEREYQVVQFSGDLDLTNRGGTMEHIDALSDEVHTSRCFAPSEMLIITVTGDVVLCYEDALRKHVMGSIVTQSIPEIWFGEPLATMRHRLAEGDRSVTSICQQCTNMAHTEPGLSAHSEPFWKTLSVAW
ncbi:SPASM domain-containing protein [Burkholderia thailandensis]|uniref:radical SAM/SPASM domain-containing protein n=1 Tax=Burkholderia thailandensis TaxID=57975 RepID=UPI0002EEE089|nr:SPASM domain-containing protein [Burkholderia thailandensis]AHI66581.1 radical SAM superfamily protein [Burkholderia thailandensis H0587]AOJ53944.1 radical SAM protein [Burkholderia thailandensis]AVR27915.1 radical SAM protein [Burkholderia thailandensis]MCS3393117.1 SPASM domain-containing protein [Burkholderia thailandensis]MCS6429038.1 SPASM domain-containing protein [Burkholderia thailandensis]